MPLVDLTHPISTGMPVYPGAESPQITQVCTVAGNGFAEKVIRFYSHTGTHMDAPSHLIANGCDLDSYPIETFKGPGVCLDLRGLSSQEIGLKKLAHLNETLISAEFLLLHTGWSQRWGDRAYFEQHPVLTTEAARWLTGFPLKGIGLDNISADRYDTQDLPIHKTLLGSDILIIENMAHLDQLPESGFQFTCLPLKLSGADGAPVRAMAEF